ncbi:hypothetical protein [Tardiphaga sp.]|uniref:hypothetical protein n=1 Tax=Tardiphaga sp. TaxID=1926292 RepID=UPI0037DA3C0A
MAKTAAERATGVEAQIGSNGAGDDVMQEKLHGAGSSISEIGHQRGSGCACESTRDLRVSDSHEHTAAGTPATSPTIKTGHSSPNPPHIKRITNIAASAAVAAVFKTLSGFAEKPQSTQANSKAGITAIA